MQCKNVVVIIFAGIFVLFINGNAVEVAVVVVVVVIVVVAVATVVVIVVVVFFFLSFSRLRHLTLLPFPLTAIHAFLDQFRRQMTLIPRRIFLFPFVIIYPIAKFVSPLIHFPRLDGKFGLLGHPGGFQQRRH